ncbi:hypothetical protein IJH33_01035 [Candidatus Saccharibacteria bacterium]|nr:hypothetical protein [Candidatus Saccharibacteria bacterium]
MKRVIRALVSSVLTILLSFFLTSPTLALSSSLLQKYATNDILFYNPSSSQDDCYYSSGGLLEGDGRVEKIWNYITNINIPGLSDNPAVISGIIGNMWNETGGTYNPFIVSKINGATGLIQWMNASYNTGFFAYMKEKNLDQYFSTERDPNLDEAIIDLGIQAEMDFLFANGTGGVIAKPFVDAIDVPVNKTGIAGARAYADLWLVTVEKAVNGDSAIEDPGVAAIATANTYQGAAARREHAETIYNQYANKTSTNVSTPVQSNATSTGTGISWTDGWIDGGTLPGYAREEPSPGWSSEADHRAYTTGKPNKILLHSTEGQSAGLSAYPTGNHYAAHFTLDAINKKVSQHYSINEASSAIKSFDTEGPIQIEIVGFSQGHTENQYSLFNFTDAEWDYIALVMTAISEATGIPLTTSVDWANPVRLSSKEEFKNYTGVLGHMHAPLPNDHHDPGNIWPMLETAFSRSPTASSLKTASGAVICTDSGTSALSAGGYLTKEDAERAIMAEYKAINPRKYGVTTEGDAYLKEYGIGDVNCESGTDLDNCVAFSIWFVNRFTNVHIPQEPHGNGSEIVQNLIARYNFTDLGTTPKVYSIFSTASGTTMCGNVKCGHTGVVLGIDPDNNKIIIGEASCADARNTGAKEYPLSNFTNGNYTFAYTEVNLEGGNTGSNTSTSSSSYNGNINITENVVNIQIPDASPAKIAWVSDLHIVNQADTGISTELAGRYDRNVDGLPLTDKNGNPYHNEDAWLPIIDYINANNFDAVIFGADIMDYYSEANARLVNEGLSRLNVPFMYLRADHDYEYKYTDIGESGTHEAHKSIVGGDDTCKVMNVNGTKVIGWNYSVMDFSNPYNQGLYNCITSNMDRNSIIATHVPIASQIDNSKLDEASRAKGHSDPYYWARGGGHWTIGGEVENLIDRIYNGCTRYVFAGHMHTNLMGNLNGVDVQLSDTAKEHVFPATYTGTIGVINITP